MRVGSRHLTYCSNIHAGETWTSVRAALGDVLPALRGELQWSGRLGIGLRLSAEAARALSDPRVLEEFRTFLAAGDYYVFTINGFPYGAFHGTRVKERVYEPDWRTPDRVVYTNRLADLLAQLSTTDDIETPSISTVPGGFRAAIQDDDARRQVAVGMLTHVAHLAGLRRRTGRTVTLAIEPEPACQLETTTEVVAFIADWLRDPDLVAAVARECAVDLSVDDVRRHVGLCLDTCHLAVAHEDPAAALDHIEQAGVRIDKVQVSSALVVESPQHGTDRAAVARFADDTYLHQVVGPEGNQLVHFTDLPEALAALKAGRAGTGPWRVHFHVPIFLESLGILRTTQDHLVQTLQAVTARDACRQFEVETYTWDVLPEEHRAIGIVPAIARELTWARRQLGGEA
jgi:hypothetical protein